MQTTVEEASARYVAHGRHPLIVRVPRFKEERIGVQSTSAFFQRIAVFQKICCIRNALLLFIWLRGMHSSITPKELEVKAIIQDSDKDCLGRLCLRRLRHSTVRFKRNQMGLSKPWSGSSAMIRNIQAC